MTGLSTPSHSDSRRRPPPARRSDAERTTFRPSDRLRRRWEFRRVQAHGHRVHTPHFVVLVLGHASGTNRLPRLGITVTKKVSASAVQRNRIKRLVREVFRAHRAAFPSRELVVIAKPGAVGLPLSVVRAELVGASAAMKRAADRPPRAGR